MSDTVVKSPRQVRCRLSHSWNLLVLFSWVEAESQVGREPIEVTPHPRLTLSGVELSTPLTTVLSTLTLVGFSLQSYCQTSC